MTLPVLVRRTEINEHGVWIMYFERDGVEVGHMFRTYHPTIPYEVFPSDMSGSHRVHTEDEAEEWLAAPVVVSPSRFRRLWQRLLCRIFGHVQRWHPEDADEYCRRCGHDFYPDEH